MKRLVQYGMFLWIAVIGVALFGDVVRAEDKVPRMTKEELKPLLGKPDVLVVDVRASGDWEKETLMIQGAIREDPMKVESWMEKYPKDKTLVFYCS